MKRENLAAVIVVDLMIDCTPFDRFPQAVSEWLDGEEWLRGQFDYRGWDFGQLVCDVMNFYCSISDKR